MPVTVLPGSGILLASSTINQPVSISLYFTMRLMTYYFTSCFPDVYMVSPWLPLLSHWTFVWTSHPAICCLSIGWNSVYSSTNKSNTYRRPSHIRSLLLQQRSLWQKSTASQNRKNNLSFLLFGFVVVVVETRSRWKFLGRPDDLGTGLRNLSKQK